MTTNLAEWASEHRQITKNRPSDASGGNTVQWRCNVGMVGVGLKVSWEMSIQMGGKPMKTAKKNLIDPTLLAARDFTRRSLLKKGAALGALAATGPFFIRSSLAASLSCRYCVRSGSPQSKPPGSNPGGNGATSSRERRSSSCPDSSICLPGWYEVERPVDTPYPLAGSSRPAVACRAYHDAFPPKSARHPSP